MSTRRQAEPSVLDKFKLEEGWFSLLASLLAFMTVVWTIQAAKWVDGSNLLPEAAVVSFLIGFGLAKVRFVPALLAHTFMLSVGTIFIALLVGPYTDDPTPNWNQRLGNTLLRVVHWCQSAIAGNAHDDNLVYLALLLFGIWVLGYSVAWVLFRGHKIWSALLMLGAVLMVNLSFNPPGAFGTFSFFLIVSLLLVVRFNAYLDEQRWRSLRMYFQPGLWRGAMGVGSCLVLVVMAVGLATPSTSQIDSLGSVLNTVSQPFNGIRGIWDSVGNGAGDDSKVQPLSQSNYSALQDSFTIGGPLRLSDDPYFRVSDLGGVAAPSYMQVVAMDEYDGQHWIDTFQSPTGQQQGDQALFRRLSLAANQSLPTSTDKGRDLTKMTITSLVPGFTPILTMGDLVSANHAALVAFHYDKVTINASLDAFVLEEISDGNGGKRSILIDKTTNQPVPPALLDLVKYLQDGSKLNQLAYPSSVTLNYTPGRDNLIQVNNGNGKVQFSGITNSSDVVTPTLQITLGASYTDDNWSYQQLPSLVQLQALGLQPGGAPQINKISGVTAVSKSDPSRVVQLDTTVYLQSSGSYILTVESPLAKDNQAQTRFEATPTGQQVLGEIKKVEGAVKGNKVTYSLTNGVPSSLQYEGYEPNYDDLSETLLPQSINPGDGYTSYALRYTADVQSLRQAPTDYPDWVTSRYLQLPANLPDSIKSLAEQLTAGTTNNYDKAEAIISYLSSFTYTTDPPPVPAGRDPIDYFLTESKAGYCVHFASSLTLMLRSLGVPTRIVNGYIGGEFDTTTNSWIVRGNAAHSWTQAYFNGIGWVDLEATPSKGFIDRPADASMIPAIPAVTPPTVGDTANNTSTGGVDPVDAISKLHPINDDGNTLATAVGTSKSEPPLWLFIALGLMLAGAGIYQVRRIYLSRQFAVPDPSPLTLYNRMSKQAERSGLKGRTGMTPNEYAAYLTRQLPEAAKSVDAITQAYVRRRYGPEDTDLYDFQREKRLAAVKEAEEKLHSVDDTGHDARQDDLWEVFRAHTEVYQDDKQVGEVWEKYQTAILQYRHGKRMEKLTPEGLRKLRGQLGPRTRRI